MPLLDSALVRRVRQSPMLRPPAIAAYRAVDRMLPAGNGPRVVANSMPKSGTHLLATLLDGLGDLRFAGRLVKFEPRDRLAPEPFLNDLDKTLRRLRPSRYIGAHLIADPQVQEVVARHDVRLVTILRDPRAVVVSGAHYVQDAPQLRDRDEALALFPTHESILTAMVRGYGEPGDKWWFPPIGERYREYADWAQSPLGLTVRFEDLIGSRGGGSDEAQLDGVTRVLDHLGYGDRGVPVRQVAEQMFSEKAITFRAGRIDSWREDLPAHLAREIEDQCATTMSLLGYQV